MAAGIDYTGRPRPRWKILLFGIITFGVYGRVWLYKTAKEMDGHQVFFLDLRLYRLGVLAPIIGPLVVKWRLANLLPEFVRHDVTAPSVRRGGLRAAAFVPWVPLFAFLFQRHLEHHWALHRRLDDLEAMKEVLEQRKKTARSQASLAEAASLEAEVHDRERALDLARQASLAIREAQIARELAEQEIRQARRARRFSLARLLRRKRAVVSSEPEELVPPTAKRRFPWSRRERLESSAEEPSEPEPPAPEIAAPTKQSRKERQAIRAAEKAREDVAPTAEGMAEEPSSADSTEEPAPKKGLFRMFQRKAAGEEDQASEAVPEPVPLEADAPTPMPTKRQRKSKTKRAASQEQS